MAWSRYLYGLLFLMFVKFDYCDFGKAIVDWILKTSTFHNKMSAVIPLKTDVFVSANILT